MDFLLAIPVFLDVLRLVFTELLTFPIREREAALVPAAVRPLRDVRRLEHFLRGHTALLQLLQLFLPLSLHRCSLAGSPFLFLCPLLITSFDELCRWDKFHESLAVCVRSISMSPVARGDIWKTRITFLVVQCDTKRHEVDVPELVAERQDVLKRGVPFGNGHLADAIPERGQGPEVWHQDLLPLN